MSIKPINSYKTTTSKLKDELTKKGIEIRKMKEAYERQIRELKLSIEKKDKVIKEKQDSIDHLDKKIKRVVKRNNQFKTENQFLTDKVVNAQKNIEDSHIRTEKLLKNIENKLQTSSKVYKELDDIKEKIDSTKKTLKKVKKSTDTIKDYTVDIKIDEMIEEDEREKVSKIKDDDNYEQKSLYICTHIKNLFFKKKKEKK